MKLSEKVQQIQLPPLGLEIPPGTYVNITGWGHLSVSFNLILFPLLYTNIHDIYQSSY